MQSVQGNTGPRWENKIERGFFRGRDSRQERLDLTVLGRANPDIFDVALTNFFFFTYDEKKYGPKNQRVSFFDFFKVIDVISNVSDKKKNLEQYAEAIVSKAPAIEIFFSKVEYPREILRKFSEQNSIVSAWLDYLTSWLASENWKFVQLWKFHKDLGNIFGGIAKRYETVWIKVFLHDTIRVGHYMEKPLITWKKYQTWKTWKVQKKYKNLEGRNYKSRNYKFFLKIWKLKRKWLSFLKIVLSYELTDFQIISFSFLERLLD